MIYFLLALIALFVFTGWFIFAPSRTHKLMIELLNEQLGGDWYYDKESGIYRDMCTKRTVRFD